MKPTRRHWLLQAAQALGWGAAVQASATVPPAPQPAQSDDRPHPGHTLRFPHDFGAHPGARTEWWYLTGQLHVAEAPASPQYGFQITFFRSRTDLAPQHPSRFAPQQLVFAHAALSDTRDALLRHDQRVARQGFGLAEADTGDTRVALHGWTLQRTGPADHSVYQSHVATPEFTLDLLATQTQPVLLQGDRGYSRKGPAPQEASHYYSQPQLLVRGQLTLNANGTGGTPQTRVAHVQGRAWLDHEWSETLLPPDAVGWDWIGMNLHDGGALTAFRLRRADGSTVWAGGSWRPPGQAARSLGPLEVRFTPGRIWHSPATQARYPVNWTVTVAGTTYTVRACFDAQELDSRASTGSVYWEGLSQLCDAQGRELGWGYLEMTGYTNSLRI